MAFSEPLTWTCHVCKEERPDAKISVRKVPPTPIPNIAAFAMFHDPGGNMVGLFKE